MNMESLMIVLKILQHKNIITTQEIDELENKVRANEYGLNIYGMYDAIEEVFSKE